MSTFFYGTALESEPAHRRAALRRDAADHRLALVARCAARARCRSYRAVGITVLAIADPARLVGEGE